MISPGQYLFYTGLVYFIAGMINIFVYKFVFDTVVLQLIWILVLCLPVFLPIGGIVRGAPLWRTK